MDEGFSLSDLPLDSLFELFARGQPFPNLKEELLFDRGVLNEAPALIHIRDQVTGKIIWWNGEWERIFHLSKAGILTDSEAFMKKIIHPDDLILLKQSNEHYLHKNIVNFGGIIRIRFPEEEEWSWLVGISRVIQKNSEGIPLKTLAIFLNFTRATHTDTKVREALREVLRNGHNRALSKITKREREVIQLLMRGYNNQQIARRLYISYHTVESHRKNIRIKLRVKNTSELISLVKDLGI